MQIGRLAAVAAMAVTAVGISAGTVNAQPTASAPAVHGVDHGIAFDTVLNEAGKAITTTVDAGSFALTKDAVTLTDKGGALVAQIPLSFHDANRAITAVPTITDNGRSLTLTPKDVALNNVGSQQWFFDQLQRASLGAAVGAVIGAIVGFFFLFAGAIPGAIAGAAIGLLVAGGQPLIDSGFAYFSGQP